MFWKNYVDVKIDLEYLKWMLENFNIKLIQSIEAVIGFISHKNKEHDLFMWVISKKRYINNYRYYSIRGLT